MAHKQVLALALSTLPKAPPRQTTPSTGQYLNILSSLDDLLPHTMSYPDNGAAFDKVSRNSVNSTDQRHTASFTQMAYDNSDCHLILVALIFGDDPFTPHFSACDENDLYDYGQNTTCLSFPSSDANLNRLVTWDETLGNVTDDSTILFFTNLPPSTLSRSSTLMVYGATESVDRSYVATAYACMIDATWTSVTLNASADDSYNQINCVLEVHYDEQTVALALANGDHGYMKYNGLLLERDDDDDPDTKALYPYLDKSHAWTPYAGVPIDIDAKGALGMGTTWDSIGELLVLGLMSRKLEYLDPHASVGLDTLHTFREPVSVKVNYEGYVELVFDNDTGSKSRRNGPVVVNKPY
ncbi:uncharacterized protein Z519_08365 [Cladophialophora bantiana CBS 173.52]|uniref:Uncharacterized protein n=1 Tax=Cladophialophora bantiana (strain ATCC 10958 / CBS 173.52 / CDC B-1940 / NIH 8579) TaxID=1442370 RepID=A0A0D2FVK9_CLAB1|nr:uncharacterized protein Z519_08365 [Cladophialophora bantiana CBS 173.52]KIW90582.1 hypothetical protein Z519_08365 [Cladophialophora bantiana CBS 173.52]